MQICPSFDYERKDIKEWDVFDYMNMLHNVADYYEFNGKQEICNAFNNIAHSLLEKEVRDYNNRKANEIEGL